MGNLKRFLSKKIYSIHWGKSKGSISKVKITIQKETIKNNWRYFYTAQGAN